jgi:hypothetical protein
MILYQSKSFWKAKETIKIVRRMPMEWEKNLCHPTEDIENIKKFKRIKHQ